MFEKRSPAHPMTGAGKSSSLNGILIRGKKKKTEWAAMVHGLRKEDGLSSCFDPTRTEEERSQQYETEEIICEGGVS